MRTWKQQKKDGLALLFIVPISPAGSLGKVAARHCSLQFHLAAPIVTPGLARRFEGQPARLQSTEKRLGYQVVWQRRCPSIATEVFSRVIVVPVSM
jgi:hypothetical protein